LSLRKAAWRGSRGFARTPCQPGTRTNKATLRHFFRELGP
jgi:hypothetical protein